MSKIIPIGIFDPLTERWWLPEELEGVEVPNDPTSVVGAVKLEGEGGPRWAVPLGAAEATGTESGFTKLSEGHRAADAHQRLKRLTPTQNRVAELAAGGMSYREIAGMLGQSPNTTRTHLKNIYKRLEIASRVELAELYVFGRGGGGANRRAAG